MHTLSLLLDARAAVLVVLGKLSQSILCIPHGVTEWSVWMGPIPNDELRRLTNVVMLFDPDEKGEFSDAGACFRIKFASTNSKKHFPNATKDGNVLYTSMPTERELLLMTEVLWKDTSQEFKTLKDQQKEALRRSRVVGCAPRYVFSSKHYKERCNHIGEAVDQIVCRADPQVALENILSILGTTATSRDISGTLFFVSAANRRDSKWSGREECSAEWNPTALKRLKSVLKEKLDIRRLCSTGSGFGDVYERFVGSILCRVDGDIPFEPRGTECGRRELVVVESENAFIERLKSLRDSDGIVLQPKSQNFPVLDFALSSTLVVNAKGSKDLSFSTKRGAALKLLQKLGMIDENGSRVGNGTITLVIAYDGSSTNVEPKHNFKGDGTVVEGDGKTLVENSVIDGCFNVVLSNSADVLERILEKEWE